MIIWLRKKVCASCRSICGQHMEFWLHVHWVYWVHLSARLFSNMDRFGVDHRPTSCLDMVIQVRSRRKVVIEICVHYLHLYRVKPELKKQRLPQYYRCFSLQYMPQHNTAGGVALNSMLEWPETTGILIGLS